MTIAPNENADGLGTGATTATKARLVREMLERVADTWTMLVIDALTDRELRFSELRDELEGISQKMLTQTLRRLERDGLVTRTVHPVVPPRVEYKLTALGESLGESLCGVWIWAEAHLEDVQRARQAFDDATSREREGSEPRETRPGGRSTPR